MKWSQGGLVFKAHRLVNHSTLGVQLEVVGSASVPRRAYSFRGGPVMFRAEGLRSPAAHKGGSRVGIRGKMRVVVWGLMRVGMRRKMREGLWFWV